VLSDGSITPVKLDAKDYADDFTTVEFSGTLAAGKTYTVVNVVYNPGTGEVDGGVADLIGNSVLNTDIEDNYFTFEYIAEAPEGPEVESYEQVNGTTFEVTMNRWIALYDGDGDGSVGTVDSVEGDTFNISVEDDVVTFEIATGGLKEDQDYTFEIDEFIKDLHGEVAINDNSTDGKTVFEGEYTDTDAPYIEEVVAKNRKTIKITFNEDVDTSSVSKADFTLRNYDTDKNITDFDIVTESGSDVDDNIIEISVTKALEARYEYELVIQKKAVQDVKGNFSDDATETFYFNGSNLKE